MTHPFEEINLNTKSASYLVEASAGTGKTWTIEKLFIKAILSASASFNSAPIRINIDQILLVTFTNASAKDLKKRISKEVTNSINILKKISIDENLIDNKCVYTKFLKTIDNKIATKVLNVALHNIDTINVHTIHSFCYQLIKTHPVFYEFSHKQINNNIDQPIKQLVTQFIRNHLVKNNQLYNKKIAWQKIRLAFYSKLVNKKSIVDFISTQLPKDIIFDNNSETQNNDNIILNLDDLINLLNDENVKYKDGKLQLAKEKKALIKDSLIYHIISFNLNQKQRHNYISYAEIIDIVSRKSSNQELSDYIFKKYPITFIDEFQDTDNKQFIIFNNVYRLDKSPRGCLILVGDPKQSIYKFRGADINNYNNVRNLVNKVLRLDVNYRSCKNIINFINKIFSSDIQGDNFLGNRINAYPLVANNDIVGQVTVNYINDTQTQKNPGKKRLEDFINQHIAQYILNNTQVLSQQSTAILAEKNHSLELLARVLSQNGINYYLVRSENIFQTSCAKKLLLILQAIILPLDESRINKAITHTFFTKWIKKPENYKSKIYEYRYLWQINHKNLLLVIHYLLSDLKTLGESITVENLVNVLHLCEILTEFLKNNSIYRMLEYLQEKIEQKTSATADIDQNNSSIKEAVRIAKNHNAVILTTIHSSKGLEFDNVICHSLPIAAKEECDSVDIWQEKNRLIYVALTRAKENLIVYCPNYEMIKSKALSRNLFFHMFNNYRNAFGDSDLQFNILDDSLFFGINNLADANDVIIDSNNTGLDNDKQAISRKLFEDYKIQSYSSISKQEKPYWLQLLIAKEKDLQNLASNLPTTPALTNSSDQHQLTTAANIFGQAFHKLCEIFPFTDIQFNKTIIKYKIAPSDVSYLSELVNKAMDSIIQNDASLKTLYSNSICEFKFKLKISKPITNSQLKKMYEKHYEKSHPFIANLDLIADILPGFLVGFIDLLYEYKGQYWIMDYKTNALPNYEYNTLLHSIADNCYHVQYLLYIMALTRYLQFKFKITQQQALDKIGGVVYFYVRGALNDTASNKGIFIDTCEEVKKICKSIEL
jgi:exodeoxyribonuclease V beta subunit